MSKKVENLQKLAIKEQQKRIKPGVCQKYVRLVLDANLLNNSFAQELLHQLNNKELKYDVRKLEMSNCIIWERNVGQHSLVSGVNLDDAWHMENQTLMLLTDRDFQRELNNQTLESIGAKLHTAFPECRYTVVVPRTRQNRNNHKSHEVNALIEMQLLQDLHVEQLGLAGCDELLALLQRYTKAIAEAPYKHQRAETLHSFKKYLANDKKQCVRVQSGGAASYGRLWQQHLNRLPLVTLEVAESIISHYSCPKRLLDHFDNNTDAVQTLADIKIKRSNGPHPLQTERRIGNVLCSKLHTLYSTRDPNTLI